MFCRFCQLWRYYSNQSGAVTPKTRWELFSALRWPEYWVSLYYWGWLHQILGHQSYHGISCGCCSGSADQLWRTSLTEHSTLICLYCHKITSISPILILAVQFWQFHTCSSPQHALEDVSIKFQGLNPIRALREVTVTPKWQSYACIPAILPFMGISWSNISACRFPILMIQRLWHIRKNCMKLS